MKKLLFFAAAALGMFAASCQKEPVNVATDGNALVTLSVEVPQAPQTKAIAQAEKADIVYFEVWNSDWSKKLPVKNEAGEPVESADVEDRKATIDLVLVADQTYNFIFWAQNKECGAYSWDKSEGGEGLKKVEVNYAVMEPKGNNDAFDAFYKKETIKVDGAVNKTVVLYRPFAQLNFGASRMSTSFGDVTVGATKVSVTGLCTTFNTLTGKGEEDSRLADPVTFSATGLAATDEKLKIEGDQNEYTWIAMDYMLMRGIDDLVKVEASFDLGMEVPVQHTIANVPLKQNYRTNIIGDLFAADAKLQIVIDKSFLKNDEGISVGLPEEIDPVGDVYNVEKAAHVLWLSQESNSNPSTFDGKTISFAADIDMMGQGFLPINLSNVKILGNGHTVSNYAVKGDSWKVGDDGNSEAAGLFGTVIGSISDLYVKDVLVEGNWSAGALVGYIYGNVTGCKATNVEINSIPYAYIKEGTFIYDDGNNVGGLIGYVGEDGYTISGNTVENAVLTGYRCIGGLVGTVQVNAVVDGNEVYNTVITVDQAYIPYVEAPKNADAGEVVGRMISTDDISDNSYDNVTIIDLEIVTSADEFQAALDAKHRNIVLMPGTYEGTFKITGNGTTIEGLEGAVVHCINLNGTDNVTLKNIAFDAANAGKAYDGKGKVKQNANIVSGGSDKPKTGSENLVVDGCTFTGTYANGGVAIAFTDQSRTSGQSGNITVKNCTFNTTGAYYDIYGHYTGKGSFVIENNTFKSTLDSRGCPVYLGRYQSNTPVVVKGNAFEKYATIDEAVYVQPHSESYTVSIDASENTFAN